MTDQRNTRIFTTASILLILLASALAFFYWRKSESAEIERNRQTANLQSLELEKSLIERQLDSLTTSYLNVRQENEDLRGKESSSAELIHQKEATIRQLKSQKRRDQQALRQQVEDLRRIKIEYETIIATLRSENEQLREANRTLTGENEQLRGENTALNDRMQDLSKQLEEQIRKTQSALFKATSFRVQLARKNDKLTVRAKKAREIFISFDLANVPVPYRGPQQLFLVVTDDKGRPVFSDNPMKTSVQAPTGPVSITYQQTKQVMLAETQRLSFTYTLDERLRAGAYVAAIYCESGLLGASSFKLE